MPYRNTRTPKPSEQLADLLSGRVAPKDTPEAVLSWARLSIYQGAQEVLSIEGKKQRQRALSKIPDEIRPYVEREAMAIWKKRRGE